MIQWGIAKKCFNCILFTDHFLSHPGEIALIIQERNYSSISSVIAMATIFIFFPLDIYVVATVLEGPHQNGQV